jgi:hypothetical protein
MKPPGDTFFRYFNVFHLAPSPSSLQFIDKLSFGVLKIGFIVQKQMSDVWLPQ